jgi:transcriptional regulator with XRE-family HTH domain
MITASQIRAARALLGFDQRKLAEVSELSLPTIQRMEASDGVIRGNVESLTKLIGALEQAGIELIGESAASLGEGRGVRLRRRADTGSRDKEADPDRANAPRASDRG